MNTKQENISSEKEKNRLYLQMPKRLTTEQFQETVKYFKKNGATFDVSQKKWYIREEQQNQFLKYLPAYHSRDKPEQEHTQIYSSGDNKTKIYLQIPKGLTREEFLETIQHFKQNGAIFNKQEKHWYIFSENETKFTKFLPQVSNPDEIKLSKSTSFSDITPLDFLTDAEDPLYCITFQNGDSFDIYYKQIQELPEEEQSHFIQKKIAEYVNQNISQNDVPMLLNYCQENATTIYEHFQNQKSLQVSNKWIKSFDNYLTFSLADGKIIRIDLEEIHTFRSSQKPPSELFDTVVLPKVEVHMQNLESLGIPIELETKENQHEIQNFVIGEAVTICVPEYQQSENALREICGLETYHGVIQKCDNQYLVIQDKDGRNISFDRSEIYDEKQVEVLKKAIEIGFEPEKLDVIGNPRMSSAQMKQVLLGLQHRLNFYQVIYYANSNIPAWQMDVYRYGMENGLSFYDMKDIVQQFTSKFSPLKPPMKAYSRAWEASHDAIKKIIKARQNAILKDLKDNNYPPHPRIIKKLGQLHSLTDKEYTIKDIIHLVKNKQEGHNDRGKLMREIYNELRFLKKQMQEMLVVVP